MSYCIDKNNLNYKIALANLTKILGNSNAAIAALELNKGYLLNKAPNGKDSLLFNSVISYLKEESPLLKQTTLVELATKIKLYVLSEDFKKEFGDWVNDPQNSSKVVDKNGEPKLIFHKSYSPIEFTEFDISQTTKDPKSVSFAYHFGTKKASDEVESFGYKNGYRFIGFLNIKNPFLWKDINVLSTYIDALNDLKNREFITDDEFLKFRDVQDPLGKLKIIKFILNRAGQYDGYLYENDVEDPGNISYGVFDSEKIIKSPISDINQKDVISLIVYQGRKQNISEDLIQQRIQQYLSGDSYSVNYVKFLLDQITIRQAQLHTMGYDFNKELYLEDGVFDWETYLGGINLNTELTENDIYKDGQLRFSPIYEYLVNPAEIIMPKIYRSNFKIGGYDLSEINEDFFKKVNPFYQSDLKEIKGDQINSKGKIDFIVRCHNYRFNIIVADLFSDVSIEGLHPIKISVENGYRIDKFGNKMYAVPVDDTTYQVYLDQKGNETIIFKRNIHEQAIKSLLHSLNNLDLVSVQPFLENIDVTDKWLKYISNINKLNTYDWRLEQLANELDEISQEDARKKLSEIYLTSKKSYESDLSSTLYNSFIKTLYVVSVRIPTLAFLSIMAAKVVGLTDDRNNNIFVTRWQFWLLGSDLDIDKSYIMGADVNRFGKYNHWSPIANYTTRKLAEISDKLPIPNQSFIVTPENYYRVSEGLTPVIIKEINPGEENLIDATLNELLVDYDLSYSKELAIVDALKRKYNVFVDKKIKDTIRLSILQKALDYILPGKEYYISKNGQQLRAYKPFINKISNHNSHIISSEEARNIVLDRIVKISLDERNMLAGYSPIDQAMDYFRNALKLVEDSAALERDLDDGGLSIARIQYDNSVGKKDVGIMANGLKAFFALTQYLNKYRKDPNLVNSNRYFLTKLSVNGKENYFSSISDILFEEEAIKILNNALHVYCPEVKDNLKLANKDASLLISSLISLATDNAKELALAKMNASVNLACVHLFLVVMGYDAKEVTKFTTSPEFSYVAKQLNSSKFKNSTPSVNSVCKNILSGKDKNYIGNLGVYNNIFFIYQCAQEMSEIAQIGAINQGMKVDELEASKFFTKLRNTIQDLIDRITMVSDLKIGLSDYTISLNGDVKKLLLDTHGIESEQLENELAVKISELNKTNQENKYIRDGFSINMYRYFEDQKYREFCTNLYDIFKFNFNVLDCINNLPHFYEMLHAFTISETSIMKSASRSRAVIEEAVRNYVPYRLYTRAQKTEYNPLVGETTTQEKIVYQTKPFSESIQRKASRFFDDYVLSEYLQENANKFTISYEVDFDTKLKKVIIPNTNDGIIDFCNFVAYYVIPNLLEKYQKTNTFLAYIRPDFKKISKSKSEVFLPKYKFNFDIDALTTVADLNKAFYIQNGFNELANITLGDLDFEIFEGSDISIAELLYLYDKITSLSGFGLDSLDRAFESYVAKNLNKDIVAKGLAKIIKEHDMQKRPDVKFDPMLFTAYCYSNQIRLTLSGIAKFDVVWDSERRKWDESNAHTIDISKRFLFNLDNIQNYLQLNLLSEKLITLLVSDKINPPEIIKTEDSTVWHLTSSSDKNLNIYFPASTTTPTLELLILDLYELSISEPESYDSIKEELINFEKEVNKKKPSLKAFLTLAVYKKFAERMKSLGVDVSIEKSDSGQNGRVENGTIILNPNSNITTTPMHELMHMIIAVMKEDDYDEFERLMNTVIKISQVEEIFNNLSESIEYDSLMELDRIEEAMCRYFESLISEDPRKSTKNDISKEDWDVIDTILDMINPYISKTLGIAPPTQLLTFLSDTISALPGYNSTLFLKTANDFTGFIDQKSKIIKSVNLTSYIESLISKGTLKQTEC